MVRFAADGEIRDVGFLAPAFSVVVGKVLDVVVGILIEDAGVVVVKEDQAARFDEREPTMAVFLDVEAVVAGVDEEVVDGFVPRNVGSVTGQDGAVEPAAEQSAANG